MTTVLRSAVFSTAVFSTAVFSTAVFSTWVHGVAHAGGFAIGEQSVVAAGTGGASTARDGDAGAAWYNPAALADGAGWRLGVNVVAAMAQLEAEGGDWSAQTDGGVSPVPNLHAARAGGDWVFGASVGVPYGGDVRWPDDWAGREEIMATQLQVVRIAPFAGWRRGDLRLAAGLHVDLAHMAIQRGLDFVDAEGDVLIDLRGAGVGADASVWLRRGAVDLGASYKSRTTVALDGEADFTTPDAFAGRLPDQQASSTLRLPDRLALGARWRRGAIAALADVEVTAWGVNEATVVAFEQEQTPDATQVNDWKTTVALRGGAEWRGDKLAVRGGAYVDPTPTRAERMAPSSPDSTRVGVGLGASYPVSEGVVLDASYGFMQLMGRTAENPESLMARYGGSAHFVGVAVRVGGGSPPSQP
jgi:long-chain fatty acid transport protein